MADPKEGEGEGLHLTGKDADLIRGFLDSAEHYLRSARRLMLTQLQRGRAPDLEATVPGQDEVIEGIFDGEQMIAADGRRYPVPANYASKSKLVSGDLLKLKIGADGSLVFKQIGPIERQKLVGELEEDGGRYLVRVNQDRYQVLAASVSYFRAGPGDRLTIVVPRGSAALWAAVENVLEKRSL